MSAQLQNHDAIPGSQADASTAMTDWPEDFPPREFIDPRKNVLGQIELVGDVWDRWLSSVSDAADQGLFDGIEPRDISSEIAQTLPDGGVFLYVVFPGDRVFGARLGPEDWAFASAATPPRGDDSPHSAGSSPASAP